MPGGKAMTYDAARRGRSLTAIVGRVAVITMIAVAVGGCQHRDYRMSLSDFVEYQQKRDEEAASEARLFRPADAAMIDSRLEAYQVGAGDVLLITVQTEDQQDAIPPMQVRVSPAGDIDLVLAGTRKVAGMTIEQVEQAVRDAYVPDYFRNISVHAELVNAKPTTVVVLGAVTAPGLVPLRSSERDLLHAVNRAGGLSDLSSGRVTLQRIRKPDQHVTVTLTDPIGIKRMLALPPLEQGDIITVHAAAPNTYYVGGLVNLPQRQMYPPGARINVLQAIAGSAGLRSDVTPTEATLIRRLDDGKDVQVRIDLTRLYAGMAPNINLEPGDILWVPETTLTRVQDFINRTLYIRAGVTYNLIGTQDLFTGDRQNVNQAGTTFLQP